MQATATTTPTSSSTPTLSHGSNQTAFSRSPVEAATRAAVGHHPVPASTPAPAIAYTTAVVQAAASAMAVAVPGGTRATVSAHEYPGTNAAGVPGCCGAVQTPGY